MGLLVGLWCKWVLQIPCLLEGFVWWNYMRIDRCLGEEFEVMKGLRQGCVISSSLLLVHQQFAW